jgi:hypothetical protein
MECFKIIEVVYKNWDQLIFASKSPENNDIVFYNSPVSWRIIFELDRDIDETILSAKFHHNRITRIRVIVYTDGRTY